MGGMGGELKEQTYVQVMAGPGAGCLLCLLCRPTKGLHGDNQVVSLWRAACSCPGLPCLLVGSLSSAASLADGLLVAPPAVLPVDHLPNLLQVCSRVAVRGV